MVSQVVLPTLEASPLMRTPGGIMRLACASFRAKVSNLCANVQTAQRLLAMAAHKDFTSFSLNAGECAQRGCIRESACPCFHASCYCWNLLQQCLTGCMAPAPHGRLSPLV